MSIPRAIRRGIRALSSAVEHFLDMEGVRGSIPLAPTIRGDLFPRKRAAERTQGGMDLAMARRGLVLWTCAFALTAGAALAAADKPKPSPSAEAPKKDAEPISSDPQLTTATFGDWVERCQRVNAGGETKRVCEVSSTVTASGQSQPLAELAIGRAKKTDPLRLTLVLPVNVSFPSTPKIQAEGDDPLEFAWRQCIPAGCFADTAFAADSQRAWRDAKTAKVESKAAGGQGFSFNVSLRGLPQALDALVKEP